jgi:rubrerythrin
MRVRRVNVLAFQRKTKMGDGPQFSQADQNQIQFMKAGGSAPPFTHTDPMSMEKEAQKRSKARARKARVKAGNNPQLPRLRVYKCPKCGYYHLTKLL